MALRITAKVRPISWLTSAWLIPAMLYSTGFSAVRSGIVMFVIPFVFAFYPELLLIEPAVKDPTSGSGGYLPGYDGQVHIAALLFLIARLVLALYLLWLYWLLAAARLRWIVYARRRHVLPVH